MIEKFMNRSRNHDKNDDIVIEVQDKKSMLPDHMLAKPTAANLSENELAERLRCSVTSVHRMRIKGNGPRFIRVGKKPIYPVKDLLEWEVKSPVSSTSDPF